MLDNNFVYVDGVRIDNVNMEEAVQKILKLISVGGKHQITTPNLDFLFNASKNKNFKQILNSSSLNIPDGKPLILISRALGIPLKEKVSGADFFVEICRVSAQKSVNVFLMGSAPGIAEKAKQNLLNKFQGLNITGTLSPSFGFEKNESESLDIVKQINEKSPDILFVGVGSPKQEIWINKYIDQLNIKIAIGVGASFDFAAGHVKIPPPIVKKIGLAWFWRLASEPRRLWKRYLINDLPYFVKIYLKAALLVKKEDNS
jgi:exopolysaccharide biosynthesis WecB/TagA/CpsF family protein